MEAGRGKLERIDGTLEGHVINDNASLEIGQDSVAIFVDSEKQIPLRVEIESNDVFAVEEGQGVGFIAAAVLKKRTNKILKNRSMDILDQVKNSDPVAYGRQQAGAIGVEEQVAFAIDSAQEIGELAKRLARLRHWLWQGSRGSP
jgi:hypothetical protein